MVLKLYEWFDLVLLSAGMNLSDGTATSPRTILYIRTNIGQYFRFLHMKFRVLLAFL